MIQTIVHHEGAAALTVADQNVKLSRSVIKLGLDIHSRLYVVVAQYDHALPKAARRFAPQEFVPWVESLLRAGHTVQARPFSCRRLSRAPPPRLFTRRAALASGCIGNCWRPARTAT